MKNKTQDGSTVMYHLRCIGVNTRQRNRNLGYILDGYTNELFQTLLLGDRK